MPILLLFCGITNAERAFTRILEPEITHHRSKLVLLQLRGRWFINTEIIVDKKIAILQYALQY
jgi:hypothetical protein